MATAEDDEIVLQEVIIDRSEVERPIVQRSDSLQIPGIEGSKPKEPLLSKLLSRSPKIAPKFPREKLKSMFRKRKLSSAFPFYKLKGVRFTKDTKDKLINESLLDISGNEPVEVEITLSTPELTEIEKETGVHPYYYTQQTITSAKQLATGTAVAVRQSTLGRSESEENKFKGHKMGPYLIRSCSLPNLSQPDEYARYAPDSVIESSLKKISELMKNKEKMKKAKTKKKSPPPKTVQQTTDDSSSDVQEPETSPDIEPPAKRNILPQITVTRCGRKSSEHIDLAPSASEQSGDSDSKSKDKDDRGRRDSAGQKGKQQPSRTPQQTAKGTTPAKECDKADTAPEPHSTSTKPQKPSSQRSKFVTEPRDDPRKVQLRKKSPPMRRPEKLAFTKYTPTKKIAGIALKSEKVPSSPTSDSAPSSPVSFIPSTSVAGRMQSVPKPEQQSERASSTSPKRSSLSESPGFRYPTAQADTTITITDSTEDLTKIPDQTCPPAPPQRHIPRTGGKGKK